MATENRDTLLIDDAEPLTTLITIRDGREVIVSVEESTTSDKTAEDALNVFGAWSDLDWDEAVEALDRIRHDSVPTAPLAE